MGHSSSRLSQLGRLSLLTSLACACARPAPPLLAPSSQPVAAAAVTDASAAPVDATPATPPTAVCESDDAACARASTEALTAALSLLPADEPAARAALLRARSRRAFAWRAYLAARAGEGEAASEILARALEVEAEAAQARAAALAAIRTETEREDGADVERIPCEVFVWDGLDAVAAFAPMHGSNLDGMAARLKSRCTEAALDARLPEAERVAVRRSLAALRDSLFTRFARPDGTMFTAYAITANERVSDVFLHLEFTPPAHTAAELRSLVRGRGAAALSGHLTVVNAEAPRLGRAWCAMARAAGRVVAPAACVARVRAAALSSAHEWLTAVRGEAPGGA